MIIVFLDYTGMDMNEKIDILKSEFQELLKKGQDWVQHLRVEINKQEWVQKLPSFIQNIPPLQLYVAFVVLFLTMFLFFIGELRFFLLILSLQLFKYDICVCVYIVASYCLLVVLCTTDD